MQCNRTTVLSKPTQTVIVLLKNKPYFFFFTAAFFFGAAFFLAAFFFVAMLGALLWLNNYSTELIKFIK